MCDDVDSGEFEEENLKKLFPEILHKQFENFNQFYKVVNKKRHRHLLTFNVVNEDTTFGCCLEHSRQEA